MGSIVVRAYRDADRAGLIELWSEVFPNDPPRNAPGLLIANKARVQPQLLLVALDRDILVGAVMAGFDGTRGWIHHLAVRSDRRRQGIGRELVARAEAGLAELGCPKVNLQVRDTNESVVEFYRSVGYEAEARVSLGKVLGESS